MHPKRADGIDSNLRAGEQRQSFVEGNRVVGQAALKVDHVEAGVCDEAKPQANQITFFLPLIRAREAESWFTASRVARSRVFRPDSLPP